MHTTGRITAPFTDEQVAALNSYQMDGRFHPFTCGGSRDDAAHEAARAEHGLPEPGILVARREGWTCPGCGYTQSWAHAAMATPLGVPAAMTSASAPREA